MKILMITDGMGLGGAETHIFALSAGLIKEGHEITLISSGGVYAERLGLIGAKCITAPLNRRDLKSISISQRILTKHIKDCHIVHAHTRFTATLVSFIRGRRRLPKIIVTAHLPFQRKGLGRYTRWGDYTLAVSEDIKKHLISEYNVAKERIYVTRNGIDLEVFSPEKRSPENLIMHVSRIDEGRAKTAFLLVEASDKLIAADPNIRIVIVGDGNKLEELKELTKKKNSLFGYEKIILTGGISNVENLLCRAKIFVGVSRALLEAMAMGIPSIASGDEGYGGIITERSIAVLKGSNFCARDLPPADSELLFSDIFRLLNNPELMDKSSRSGFRCVTGEYSAKAFTQDAVDAYKKLLRERSATLLGYFGFGNLGDEAICRVAINALYSRGIENLSVLVNNKGAKKTKGLPVEKATAVSRSNIFKLIASLKRNDMLILPGGSLLQNETSLRSLIYYTSVMKLAGIMGRRVYMLSSGIGAIRGRIARLVCASALRRCFFVGARTSADLAVIRAFRKKQNTTFMPDICFLLYGDTNGVGRTSNKAEVNQKSLSDNGCFAIIPSTHYAPSLKTVEKLENVTGLKANIIIISPKADNGCLRYYTNSSLPVFIPENESEMINTISIQRFVISSRLHGAVFSLISGVPCFVYSEKEKNRALVSEIEGRAENGFLYPFYKEEIEKSLSRYEVKSGNDCKTFTNSSVFSFDVKKLNDAYIRNKKIADSHPTLMNYLNDRINHCLDNLFGKENDLYNK